MKTLGKPNILVVCGRNKRRSRTAEYIFKNDHRFNIKTAGLSAKSEIQINEKLIKWADMIIAMDNGQRNRIANQYRDLGLPIIEVIDIPDDYEYLNPELIEILTIKINGTLRSNYKI
jgi:predicted protein tyrosine phosphatase